MSSLLGIEQANKLHAQSAPYVKLMRDSIVGVPALKAPENQKIYLPSPICDDADPNEADEQYKRIVKAAEYDNVPSTTLDALSGALNHQLNNYEGIPAQMDYLIDDADGDGLTLDEHVKIVQSELLQMRWCCGLAEYSDLASLGLGDEQLTAAQVRELGLRASIKIYPRESVRAWDFKRVKGTKQLSMIILHEIETETDPETLCAEEINVYLLLGLDDDGYYQRRYIEGKTDNNGWSEKFYPKQASGQAFKFIPLDFAMQGNYPKGVIPAELGYLFPIADKCLARYNVNAQMKEALWFSGAPVSWSSGWDEMSFKIYKEMTGKDYISAGAGAHVPLPEGAQYGVMDWQAESSAFFTYLDRNAREIQALGGVFETELGAEEQTATAKVINAAEKMSVLSSIQSGCESFYNNMVDWCGMYEGYYDLEVDIKLNREFMGVKLTPQERDAIRNDFIQGLIGREEALKQLEKGGVLTQNAETILTQMTLSGEEV